MRYKVSHIKDVPGYSVKDTIVHVDLGGDKRRNPCHMLCECQRKEDAVLICDALNAVEEKTEITVLGTNRDDLHKLANSLDFKKP